MHVAGKQERAVTHENLDENESLLHERNPDEVILLPVSSGFTARNPIPHQRC